MISEEKFKSEDAERRQASDHNRSSRSSAQGIKPGEIVFIE